MPNPRTHATPQQQEATHTQEVAEAYRRLAASPDFGVFYVAMRDKMQAARSQLPTIIVSEQDKADYNQLVGFVQGIEVMFLTVKKYLTEAA